MDGEKFDDLLKRICTTRLTRFDALRGLVAGAAAALTGASLASDEATARKGRAKKKGGAKKGRGGQGRDVRAATETTNTRCACTDDLSPKQCPAQSGIEYTCKLCPGIKKGSVQVACDDDTPSCFCQSKECVVGRKTFKKGQPVNVCTPERCPTADSCDDDNPCTEDKCVDGYCVHKPVVCPPSNNKCEEVFCDPEKGCKTRPIVCEPRDKCETATCDPDKGCKYTPIVCNDDDPCTTDRCDPEKGCKHDPVVCEPENKCQKNCVCVPQKDGSHKCECERVICNDDDPCTTDRCDPEKGCKHDPVVCEPENKCQKNCVCVPQKDGSHKCECERVVCDPENLCQKDCVCDPYDGSCSCDPVVCEPRNKCETAACEPDKGCKYTPITCPPRAGCDGTCDPNRGCVYTCICTEGESPQGCPTNTSPKYTCHRCAGNTQGALQVGCDGSDPYCYCQANTCTVGTTTYSKNQRVDVCPPVQCDTGLPV